MEEKEELLKVSPKFKFIYELGMPTGKKIRSSLIAVVISVLLLVFGNFLVGYIKLGDSVEKENISSVYNTVVLIILGFFVLKFVVHIIFQILQYRSITYTFYNDSVEYKDTFWNQQTKVVRYENIKEIEVRKNIWERINRCGIIILYTSAEKVKSKGLVIYSVSNVDEIYDSIKRMIDACNIKADNAALPKNESEN